MKRNLTERQKKILKEFQEDEAEARKIREEEADWEFINRQRSPLKEALVLYVKIGDLHLAARIAGMTVDEFNEFRIKAKIPVVL